MNREQFEIMLKLMGCDDNTVQFGLNAFDMGVEYGSYTALQGSVFSRASDGAVGTVAGNTSDDTGLASVCTTPLQGTRG
jgi:hypothetical protein